LGAVPLCLTDIALQQFEFYTQLIACQAFFKNDRYLFGVLHKFILNQGLGAF
jgi:hypothetical protein